MTPAATAPRSLPAAASALLLWLLAEPALGASSAVANVSSEWEYGHGDHGVDHWSEIEPRCSGTHQSPISLSEAVFDPKLRHMHFEGYHDGEGTSFRFVNDGHTAKIYLPRLFYLLGGDLQGRYVAESVHFHWGKRSSQGSEHAIHGHRFPMEMHIVHIHDQYRNLADVEANGTNDALAVTAFLFEISEEDNEFLQKIVDGLHHIREADHETLIPGFPLDNILPAHHHYYYRYEGSLTVPSCIEKVTWNVFADRIQISSKQLVQFRLLKDHHGHGLYDNFRPEQKLNDRIIYTNMFNSSYLHFEETKPVPLGGQKLQPSLFVFGFLIVICVELV